MSSSLFVYFHIFNFNSYYYFVTAISKRQSVPNLVTLFDRQKAAIQEEDPYTLPGNNSSSSGGSRSSGHYVSTGPMSPPPPPTSNGSTNNSKNKSSSDDPKPPKLPPRDFERKNKSRLLSSSKKFSSKNQLPKDTEDENQYSIMPLNNNPRTFGQFSLFFIYVSINHFSFFFRLHSQWLSSSMSQFLF